ncbi:patatin family protein [Lacticaseibacillus pabuli]|uniref:Patatin family protein n=1 Tax=Lacticaseibacillus pabuli TaxID=3025672 RepID=A0ABY7WU66_9LACO|nr:patatin family protein [Lacticaseibacillus sp. KACC 23028]WDF83314.1 patatin family protein [Lacticaseibacillus sp. KACC 23028]
MYKAALVLEGGALRGQYTAGVLDTFMDQRVQFETVIGVSAGALCGTNYISNQRGRTNDINVNYRHDKNYIAMRRALLRKDIINLDYLFEEHGDSWEDFDHETYDNSPMKFVVVATALMHGRAVYFDHPQGKDLVQTLKASSAMPFITAPQSTPQGLCLDGGIADSIPFEYAQLAGYDKIVVIRTRNREYRKGPDPMALDRAYEHSFGDYPEFVTAAKSRPTMYNHQADELDRLEKAGKVFVIAPKEPVTVKRLEGDTDKLSMLHATGQHEAADRMMAMRMYCESASI